MEAKFFRFLKLVGTGYKVRVENGGRLVHLKLGYSHAIELPVPPSVRVFCFKADNKIVCAGIDKQTTHQFAASLRSVKPPEIYQGTGIRYADEVLKLKPGKKGRKQQK